MEILVDNVNIKLKDTVFDALRGSGVFPRKSGHAMHRDENRNFDLILNFTTFTTGGRCLDDTNYCQYTYSSGMCGGGSSRKCCVEESFEFGDYYWNHYTGYALSGYATPSNYQYSSLSAAQSACISLANSCSGKM